MARDLFRNKKEDKLKDEIKETKKIFGKQKEELDFPEAPKEEQNIEEPKEIYVTEHEALVRRLNQLMVNDDYILAILIEVCKESNIDLDKIFKS